MPTGLKMTLVVGFVGLVALTLYLVSRPGEGPKQDLPFDATAPASEMAQDLTKSMQAEPKTGRQPQTPARNRTSTPDRNTSPGRTSPASNTRTSPGRTINPGRTTTPPGRNGAGITRPNPTQPTPRPTAPPRATIPPADPEPTVRIDTPTRTSPATTPPPSEPVTRPPTTGSPVTRPTVPIARPETTPADPAPTPTAIPTPPSRRDEPLAPRGTQAPKPSTRRGGEREHVIESGDNLSYIADHYYGDERMWKAIQLANPNVNPTRLKIGDKLVIPSEADAREMIARQRAAERPIPAPKPASELTYVVASGDSLSKIARVVLGDVARWKEIYALNRDQLESPDDIKAGMKLKMPKK